MPKIKKDKKTKKKLNVCNENKYLINNKVRKGLGVTENAKILMD